MQQKLSRLENNCWTNPCFCPCNASPNLIISVSPNGFMIRFDEGQKCCLPQNRNRCFFD